MSSRVLSLVERAKMTEHTFMVFVAIIIGVLAGFGAVIIRAMIKAISDFSFPGSKSLLENITAAPWYIKLLLPALGGLVVGPIIYFFAKEAKGHGVPEVMQSVIMKGGKIRPRVAIVKAVTSAITIGTGGSVGREGPIVQIGSSIGSSIAQFFRVSSNRTKTFVGCGAAAGIAAAFNAPIAGALFAVEIIMRDFAFAHFSPIVIASVMATVISHHYEGNFAAFQVPVYHMVSPYELIFYGILGIVCAVVSFIFIKVLYFSEDFFDERLKMPEYLKPALGGLIIGAIAIGFPEVMGIGYDTINNALHGRMIWYIALSLILLKIFATSITLGSGGSGGIFAPSLFLGAMVGCAFGWLVNNFYPEITAQQGAYALVAMGGLVAGTTHAPITAIIIVFELTNDYKIILPLMITCILSTIFSSRFSRESIYTLKLLLRNINIKDGSEVNIMKSIFVKDVYSNQFESIPESTKFDDVVNYVISGKVPYFIVVDKKDTATGIISLNDINEQLFDRDVLQNLLIAKDIANSDLITISSEDNCQKALDEMAANDLEGLPVVNPGKTGKVLGMIWRKDILDAYNKEVERRDITSAFASKITMKNINGDVHFTEGHAIVEIPPPVNFIGKSIKELNIRAKYGVDVILIRSNTEQGSKIKAIPSPDYIISFNDSLVIAGEIGKINMLKSMT
ncbi:MAG: chloride channel protein [Spirochaetes bacterium]|nr:chloride channel protein [Spirochaetota bacterium]